MPTILTKKSDTPGAVPATANLTNAAGGAELAVNTADKRLFTITSGSAVVELGTNPSSVSTADLSATVLRSTSATITNLLATSATVSSGSTLNGGVVINEPGADADTRIEGDTDANLFFVDASTDRIGIGTSSPATLLNLSNSTGPVIRLTNTDTTLETGNNVGKIEFEGKDASVGAAGVTASIETEIQGFSGATDLFFKTGTAASVTDRYRIKFDGTSIWTIGTERMRLDSSGNLGLGVTPSAWGGGSSAIQLINGQSLSQYGMARNAYYDGSAYKYIATSPASLYQQSANEHIWYQAPSGTAGNAITFTQAMTLDASGNLGVGTASPKGRLHTDVPTANTPALIVTSDQFTGSYNGGRIRLGTYSSESFGAEIFAIQSGFADNMGLGFSVEKPSVGRIEAARITSGGDLLVGTTNNGYSLKTVIDGSFGVITGGNGNRNVQINLVSNENFNGAATAVYVGRDGTTSRSINAGGTVNASGADYAEYMTKAGDFTLAKGDVCGIDANGKLTNVFADSVSFVVKSTDPSYVGGDSWGADIEGEELEAARQKVDRIAFAGQVPVNVLGATPGQYIVPVNDNGAIKGEAVSSPTFEQYQLAVGKVIAIEDDGRARIIVKVA